MIQLGNSEVKGSGSFNIGDDSFTLPLDRGLDTQVITSKGDGTTEWKNKQSNLISKMSILQTFLNIQDIISPIIPSTSFVLIGDPINTGITTFKLPLIVGKKYFFSADLSVDNGEMDKSYEFIVNTNISWESDLIIKRGSHVWFQDGYEVITYSVNSCKKLIQNVAQQFYTLDAGGGEYDLINISGYINVIGSSDDLTISCRNTTTMVETNLAPVDVLRCVMTAIECE